MHENSLIVNSMLGNEDDSGSTGWVEVLKN